MKAMTLAAILATAGALALAVPAHADPDTAFNKELNGYGIYGPPDKQAWVGKLVCKRLDHGVDTNANQSVHFVSQNTTRGTTEVQNWQFLGAAINTYCPEHRNIWDEAAAQRP